MKSIIPKLIIYAVALVAFAGLFIACVARPGVSVHNPQQGKSPPVTANSTVASADNEPASNENPQAGQAGSDNISVLLRAEDYDKAIENGRAALAASPLDNNLKQKLADAYIARAWFYKSKRLTTYTLADLFKAVEVAPDYYRAHYEIGRFHNNQWQFSIGLLDLNKALFLKPDFAPAYAERAYSNYKNQKFEQALADANKAVELDPLDPRTYCTRSLVYLATGKPDLALEDANKAVQVAPSDAPSYYNRSLVYTAGQKPDLAIVDLETTLRLSQDDLLTARANADLQKLRK